MLLKTTSSTFTKENSLRESGTTYHTAQEIDFQGLAEYDPHSKPGDEKIYREINRHASVEKEYFFDRLQNVKRPVNNSEFKVRFERQGLQKLKTSGMTKNSPLMQSDHQF